MDDPTVPFELGRMWLGDAPWPFFIEIAFRSILAYAYCFVLIRLLSGRAVAQMSMTDFVLVIALGSAVGDMTFYADVPILHALAVITLVILITKILDRAMHSSALFKAALDNTPVVLVRNGVIDQKGTKRRDMNNLEVMERLRLKGIRNLGQVEWAFMEADGDMSVFCFEKPHPGLSIVPPHDLVPTPDPAPPPLEGPLCCQGCGDHQALPAAAQPCPNCGATKRAPLSRAAE